MGSFLVACPVYCVCFKCAILAKCCLLKLTFFTGRARVCRATHTLAVDTAAAVLALKVAAAHISRHLTAFACRVTRDNEVACSCRTLSGIPGRSDLCHVFSLTFESVLTEALVLILSRQHAVTAVEAGPAVARAVVHTLGDGSAFCETVGQIHLLVVDGNLDKQCLTGLSYYKKSHVFCL